MVFLKVFREQFRYFFCVSEILEGFDLLRKLWHPWPKFSDKVQACDRFVSLRECLWEFGHGFDVLVRVLEMFEGLLSVLEWFPKVVTVRNVFAEFGRGRRGLVGCRVWFLKPHGVCKGL